MLKIAAFLAVQLFALEIVLMIFFSLKQDYDAEMWKYTRDLKINVSDARAHVHRANGSAKLMGVEVEIGNEGLRSFDLPPPDALGGWGPGTHSLPYFVLTMGDSFTLGWGVENDKTYPSLMLKGCKIKGLTEPWVVNAGVGNYNLEQVAASAAELIPKIRPSAILYGFYWNDAEPVQREPNSWLARHSHILLFWRKIQVRLLHFGGQQNSYRSYYESTYTGESWARFEKAARDLSDWAKLRKTPLYVALLPELRVPNDPSIKAIYEKVDKLFQSLGARTVNLFGQLPARPMTEYWVAPDDPHPNALAHHEIARGIQKQFWPECLRP
jgi:hypothetical protein